MSRPQWLRLHRYAGLTMALFLLVQAMTGALLLYRGPVERWLDPAGQTSRSQGAIVSAGRAMAAASAAVPGARVTRLFAPDASRAIWFAQMVRRDGGSAYATVDPAGGAVLRIGGLSRFPMEAALQLHYRLLSGRAGMAVIAMNGLALLLMAVSGLAYWWPKRNPARALAIRWSLSPRLVLRQAHRTVGVIAAAFLILLSATGFLLVFPDLLESGGGAPPAVPTAVQTDRALALAHSAFPGAALRDIRIGGDRLTVNLHAPERNARAVHVVVVALADPHLISVTPAERSPALWMPLLPIHTGDFLAPVGPPVWLLVALSLAALAITGPIMWWHIAAQRHRARRKALA
ncbi:PepSY-associated TM helix domain-containing protein [Flavisphingomonas formosensis]|uniref:PepSY-associated TM helix domain-containing protein n=1 Tax=Flavisphingomonas formosensis TaxID=861534 RepID=UPI0012F92710|nr:PepSY-associated TM helix domain-containing protein [Sphingomonas formosensis]